MIPSLLTMHKLVKQYTKSVFGAHLTVRCDFCRKLIDKGGPIFSGFHSIMTPKRISKPFESSEFWFVPEAARSAISVPKVVPQSLRVPCFGTKFARWMRKRFFAENTITYCVEWASPPVTWTIPADMVLSPCVRYSNWFYSIFENSEIATRGRYSNPFYGIFEFSKIRKFKKNTLYGILISNRLK